MELETIRSMIYEVRGVRVMLDFDLARLYQVENRTLKQAVRRNMDRFPDDFMLKLTKEEANRLMLIGISQNVISPGYNPGPGQVFAFTEEGVAMLSEKSCGGECQHRDYACFCRDKESSCCDRPAVG